MKSKERLSRLDLQSCLPGCADKDVAIACGMASKCGSRPSLLIVEAMPPIRCSCFSSKTQAIGADEARWMDISEGRSEDSVGMVHGSNTMLQWPRAAAARAPKCFRLSVDRASSVW